MLLDRLGEGGMGEVWRAWDCAADRVVAAKVLGPHDGGLLLRFVREQSVRVAHRHVLAPTGWAADDRAVVLTTDLVRGGSLEMLLAEHAPMPAAYAVELLDQ